MGLLFMVHLMVVACDVSARGRLVPHKDKKRFWIEIIGLYIRTRRHVDILQVKKTASHSVYLSYTQKYS